MTEKKQVRKKRSKSRTVQLVTFCLFLVIIYAFTFINLFSEKKDFSENENRVLAQFPSTKLSNVFFGDFDTEFETWFSDHFFARDFWIEAKASTRKTMGAIENNSVYFAKDGRLVQSHLTFDEKTLNNNIEYINEFTEENGITANVIIVPDASFGEKKELPIGAYSVDEREWIQNMEQQFSSQNFIDLTDYFSTSSGYYFKTDHHWNELGAKACYEVICRKILNKAPQSFKLTEVSSEFYGTMYSKSGAFWSDPDSLYRIDPETENPVTVTYEDGTSMDSLYAEENLSIKDAYTYYLGGNHALTQIDTSIANGKTALILKDSYAHILAPYLAQEYEHLILVDLRYYQSAVSQSFGWQHRFLCDLQL